MKPNLMISHRKFIALYTSIILTGFLPASRWIGAALGNWIFTSLPNEIFLHTDPFFYPEKRNEILSYVISIFFFCAYCTAIYLVIRYGPERKTPSYLKIITWLLAAILSSFLLWCTPGHFRLILGLVVALIPFAHLTIPILNFLYNRRFISYIIILAASASLGLMLAPLILEKPKIGSELLDIPTFTKGRLPDDHYLDTTAYLNNDKFFGFRKIDPRVTTHLADFYPSAKVGMTTKLNELLANENNIISTGLYTHSNKIPETRFNLQTFQFEKIRYNNSTNELIILDELDDDLSAKILDAVSITDRPEIIDLISRNKSRTDELKSHKYSLDETDFLEKNYNEFYDDYLDRKMLHHHNFLLGAIQQLSKGRPSAEINMQYGYIPVKAFQLILSATNSLSLQGYLLLLDSFYLLYYILAVWSVYYITRSFQLTALYAVLAVAVQGFIGYDVLTTAPGMNPIRHLFDLATFALLFSYIKHQNYKRFSTLITLCLLSVLNNKETGLFLSCAILGTLAIWKLTTESGKNRIPVIESGSLFLALLLCRLFPGQDVLAPYYLAGLCGYPTNPWYVFQFFALSSLCIGILIAYWERISHEWSFLLIASVLYSQMMFLYYIWGGSQFHLMNYVCVYGLTAIILLRILIDLNLGSTYLNILRPAIGSIMALSLVALAAGDRVFFHQEAKFLKGFKNHEIFTWDFSKAKIETTMQPDMISETVDTIKKYQSDPAMKIISQYDNFLPFLADKYSDMPYPDLKWFINSNREITTCIKYINKVKPKLLFVDSQFSDPESDNEFIDENAQKVGVLRTESVLKRRRLQVLENIFYAVKSDYTQINKGPLLSVWKRNE